MLLIKSCYVFGIGMGVQLPKQVVIARCTRCGKNHGGRPCLVGQNVCICCGKPGHMAKDCTTNLSRPANKPQHQEGTSPSMLRRPLCPTI